MRARKIGPAVAKRVQALVLAPPQVRIQTAVCLRHIAQHDYPDHWPTLLPGLIACIQSLNPTQIYGGLLGLRSLVEKYEFKPRDQGREPLEQIVQVLSHARCCKRTPFRKTEGAREKGSDAAREQGSSGGRRFAYVIPVSQRGQPSWAGTGPLLPVYAAVALDGCGAYLCGANACAPGHVPHSAQATDSTTSAHGLGLWRDAEAHSQDLLVLHSVRDFGVCSKRSGLLAVDVRL